MLSLHPKEANTLSHPRPSLQRPSSLRELDTLTDYEIDALTDDYSVNLADGHASQEMPDPLARVLTSLTDLWNGCTRRPSHRIENGFRSAFAKLAASPTMASLPEFKICPTASNSADIVSAVLRQKCLQTRLIEPAFDNLALLLRRRSVVLDSLAERELREAAANGSLPAFLDTKRCDALFLVQPNNPTGHLLDEKDFRIITEYCAFRKMILILDNSFRLYKREPFDDYSVLLDSRTSFMAFEDTGKVFPTNDDKASLLFYSPDLAGAVTAVYNELFLRTSPFPLSFLTEIVEETAECGLQSTIWQQLDDRRILLRQALHGTGLEVAASSIRSQLPVEWLDTSALGMNDLQTTREFAALGLKILPGRQFHWNSSHRPECQKNVRLALMKPMETVGRACEILGSQVRTSCTATTAYQLIDS